MGVYEYMIWYHGFYAPVKQQRKQLTLQNGRKLDLRELFESKGKFGYWLWANIKIYIFTQNNVTYSVTISTWWWGYNVHFSLLQIHASSDMQKWNF